MSRRLFRKALNHIESRSCDSNISRLNDELKKTGMLSERMTTSTVLPATETQPFIPPTTSDIPDTSGLLGNSFSQPSYGGNESDPSTWDTGWNSNAYLKNPNILDGVANRPILALPDAPYPYDDGAGDSAIVTYGGFYGTSVGLITPDNKYRQILVGGLIGGTEVPSEASRGFNGVYRGMSDENFNYAVAFYNTYSQLEAKRVAGELERGSLKVWILFNHHHHGGSYDAYSGVKSNNHILTTVQYYKQANTYTSDPGQPRTIVLNRLDDPSSPDYYEGDFSRFLANLLDVGKQAFDYLVGASDDFLAGDAVVDALGNFLEPLSAVTYAADAFQAFLGQQQGTVNYTEDNPKKVSMPSQDKQAISNALNDVMQDIPLERWENLNQEDLDKINNTLNPSSGPTPSNPDIPVGARTKRIDEYHLIFNNIGKSDAFKGQIKTDKNGNPYVAGIKDNYVFTNDADASVAGAPALINFFANAFGAQDRMGDTPYEYTSGDANAELAQLKRNQEKYPNNPELWDTSDSQVTFKLKNMPILMDIPAPNNNRTTKESFTISEGWQSPDHTNVEKDSKTRWFNPNAGTDSAKWFDPKEVKPAYPAKAPPKMIDGYSADSNLAPKPVEKSPAIKLTKKDLLRNHKLKDSEVAGMMQTIARLNKFIADHPEELIFAKSRYPKHDPRLAELNWNMDQMLKASGEYLDKQFPENERLFARIQNSIVKNIKATDPEEYKEVISTIEAEKKARKIKKSHLSRKVSERERKSAFSRALKHLPTEARVQSDVTKERIEEIAKAELEYLKTIGKPKYYDWKDDGFDFSENFEDRKKSIQHFHSLIDKRIENLENALEEGMTTSEYIKQLYGEIPTITSIMSIDPNLLGSKFAQDVVQDSEKATTHAYGSYFPGSYVNSIGDFNPQSYSKVDVLATASWNSLQSLGPSGWEPDSSYEYVDSVSDVVTFGQESDVFKDTHFGEVTVNGVDFSLSTGDDEDSSQENTIDILDLESLFPGVTFPTAYPMPGETQREDPTEASMLLRTFKSIKVGQEITFNYSFTTTETEEDDDVTYRGATREVPGDDGIMDDYAFVLIAGRVQKIVSVMARDGNNIDFNFRPDADGLSKPDVLQSRFPLTGRYRYTVKQDDIDDHGNLKVFVGVMDSGDAAFESNLDITNFQLDGARLAAGQLGKTTDAYDLGTSVASLDPNKKNKKKKKKDEEKRKKEKEKEIPLWKVLRDGRSKYSTKKLDGPFSSSEYDIWRGNVDTILLYNPDLTPTQAGKEAGKLSKRLKKSIPYRVDQDSPDPKKKDPVPSFMDIQVGDERITKVNNRTVTDTTRGIKDGTSTYIDRQGNLRIKQPKPQPKPTTTTTNNTDKTSSTTYTVSDVTYDAKTGQAINPDTGRPLIDQESPGANPNLIGRGLRSATDQARYGGKIMFQGNPAGRAPGLSNYWSPEPQAAATYSNPGKGKGIPGRGPNPTGTLTTAQRPPGTPRVTRGLTGTPQFKFPAGSPPPSNMLTQMADDAAVSAGKKAAATAAGKTLGRLVPVVSIGIAVADAGVRASKGDYAGAVLSGLSAIPGPPGWAALGVQIATDTAGFTGGVKEQQEFDNYGDYIKDAAKIAKRDKIKIDRNAMLDLFLRELSKNNKLSSKDKEFLVAIFTDAEGLEKDDVITFIKKIQKKLMDGKSIKEQLYPGQPSPNGFPDTPPPKLAPNGYHPEFGKRANRYRRLDPVSAVMMRKVGTDDPKTNKQVSDAARKPK